MATRTMDDDLTHHLAAIGRWIEEYRADARPLPGLSSDERKQLHAVNKSIQHLASLGVSIPDELRNLKLKLSAKDVVQPADSVARSEDVAELRRALASLQQAARAVQRPQLIRGSVSRARQNYDVTLVELIQHGHLLTIDTLEPAWKKGDTPIEGKVRNDGAVMARTTAGWAEFKTLSAAAHAIAGQSLNGWLHWRRVNANGSRTTLKDIRAEFMNKGDAQ